MSGGGGKGGSSSSTVSIPPEVLARYNAVNAKAEQTAQQPFTPYSNDPNAFVAPLTPTQQQGIANTNAAAGLAQPWYQQAGQAASQGYGQGQKYLGAATQAGEAGFGQGQNYLQAATNYTQAGGLGVNPQQYSSGQIAQYMNPYANAVIGGTLAPLQQQQAQDRQNLLSSNIKSGAFGGDRAAIADAVLRGQQEMATGNVVSGLLNPMYNQAQQEFNTQQGVNLAAQQANRQAIQQTGQALGALGQQGYTQTQGLAQLYGNLGQQGYGMGTGLASTLGQLGTGAQTAALTGAQAQLSAGQQQQQTQQAGLTALYNQFLQQQSYPFQVTQFLANIAEGTGALSGSTTTGQQSGGFFSDERVKEDIEQIGETYDGQKIIKFRYKGDHGPKQIGLSAQDVEKHHPHAVGDYHGIKTVDYDEATRDAAHRGHFYAGGLASMGGAALDTGYRQNFDLGGSPDQSALMAQLGLGRQPINPYGSMAGQQSAVPTQRNIMTGSMATPKGLMTANLPPKQPSGLSQAMSFGKGLSDVVGSRGTKDKSGDYSGGSGLAGLYQSGKDFFADKPAAANGGRMGYADGGGDDDPTDNQTNQFKPEPDDPLAHQGKMVIPDDNPQAKLATAQLPGGGGGGGLGGLLGGAGSFATGLSNLAEFFSNGGLAGREHHADGKTVGDSDGGGGGDESDTSLPTPKNIYNTLIGTGASPKAALVLTGAAASESNFNPTAKHDYDENGVPRGYGLFGHNGPRLDAMRQDAGTDTPDWKQQVLFAHKELSSNPKWMAMLENAQSPDDLAKIQMHFERPKGYTPDKPEAGHNYTGRLATIQNFMPLTIGQDVQYKAPSISGSQSALGAGKKQLAPLDEGALGAIQKIPGIGRLAKSEEQGGLSDNAKLAILGGIGGMLASPNRSFLGALGSGLTSGVEAYQGLGGLGVQQQLANLKEQYAPVAADLTSAEASAKRAETQRASTAITSMGIFKFGADGKTYTQKEYNELEAQGKAPPLLGYIPSDSEKRVREKVGLPVTETTTGTTGAQLVPKKETAAPTFVPTPTYDEKSQAAAKQDDVTGTTPQAMEAAKEASKNYATNVQQGAQAARDTAIMTRDQIKQLIDNKEKGIVQTGALFNFGAGATNLINSIGRQFGIENVAGNADAQKQVLDKINTLSASQLAALGGQHAVEAMRRLIEASANPTMSPEAWSEILSSLGAQGVRSRDQANHLSQWNKDSGGYSHNAGADFERLHTPERYDAEKNAYKDLMLNNPAAFRALSSGKFTREQIDKKLESLYPGTRNMSRWFLGGT